MTYRPSRNGGRRGPAPSRPSGASGSGRRVRGQVTTLNFMLLAVSAAAGVVSWIVGTTLYALFIDSMPRALLIGIIFAVLAGILAAAVYIYSLLSSNFTENIITGDDNPVINIVSLVGGTVLVFVAALIFQWLYGLDFGKVEVGPSSYIFVIDESGSMEESDPNGLRYKAIEDVLADRPDDFQYMIYGFANDCHIIREMAPKSAGLEEIPNTYEGGTSIYLTLNQLLSDYDNKVWQGGNSPKVILLTDGYATDLGGLFSGYNLSKVLKNYSKNRISVSTVGLLYADESLMETIARKTGGIFINVDNVSQLSEALNTAAKNYTSRDLLSARTQANLNFLYGLMRIVFLTLLGAAIGFIGAVAYGSQDSSTTIVVSSAIESLIGSILMEIGIEVFGFGSKIMWLILWILFALLIGTTIARQRGRSERQLTQ